MTNKQMGEDIGDQGKMEPVVVRFVWDGDEHRAVWSAPKEGFPRGIVSLERLDGLDALRHERWVPVMPTHSEFARTLLEGAGIFPKVEVPS